MKAFMRRGLGSGFFVALFVAAFCVPSWAGTARYWIGGSTANPGKWSDTANWSSGCPANDDPVYFLSTGIGNPNPTNDLSGLSLSSLTFNSGAAPITLTGNPISLNLASGTCGIYQNSANPVTIDNALSWTGSNALTLQSQGAGGLVLAGGLSTSAVGSVVSIAGGSVSFSSSSFGTGTNGNLRVGNNAPASLTIQNGASLNVGGELDVNYQNTLGSPSTLTLNSGSLTVSGANQTIIGRASLRTGPGTTSAAFYQTGGTAMLGGLLTVAYNGTATSLFDIDGGSLCANGGLVVGDGTTGRAGNGSVNIHGSGAVTIANGPGLVVGRDSTLTTTGKLTLSSGSLQVYGNFTLGSGGIASFNRTGGVLGVTGSLTVGGVATLTLDNTSGPVSTAFGGGLARTGSGTLVIIPENGHLASGESVAFGVAPSVNHRTIGPWLIAQASGADSTGTYLTYSGSLLCASYTTAGFSYTTVGNELLDVPSGSWISDSGKHPWALRVDGSVAILTNAVTLGSGGLVLNGGTAASANITGGTLALGANQGLFYAGSSNPAATGGTIQSPISGSNGFQKFGPATLVLSGSNSGLLSGPVTVDTGVLRLTSSTGLGSGVATVATGAAIELSSPTSIAVANALTLTGAGVPALAGSGSGALRNVAGNNSTSGTISLAGDTQINVDGGMLTLKGAVKGPSCNLTKAGTGTLVLAGNSTSFPASLAVSAGTVLLANNNALGVGSSVAVATAAAVQLQGGLTLSGSASLILSGAGGGNGALENVQGDNTWWGPISLAGDSTVGIDGVQDTLTLSGPISGSYALTKVGTGTLQLSSSASSFTGALSISGGTLKLSSVNNAGSNGPFGAGLLPVVLGSSGKTVRLWYTGASAGTNRGFTLAANATGDLDVDSPAANLTLSGPIGGAGNLSKSGSGTLTLAGVNSYLGSTLVNSGTLTVSGNGSLASTSIIVAGNLTIYNASGANSGNRIADNAPVTLAGGTLNFSNDGSSSNFSETIGLLNLAGGVSTVCTSLAGSGGSSTLTLGGISRTTGRTLDFTGTGLGASLANVVAIAGQPTGFLGGYATSGNDWVRYAQVGSGVYSVQPFPASAYETRGESYWTTGIYPRLTSGTTTVSASVDRTISSLNLAASSEITLDIPDGRTLHIDGGIASNSDVGGILISGGSAVTIAASGLNQTGAITAGLPSQPGELLVEQNSTANACISASVTDNGDAAYPVAFSKAGMGTLILSGSNSYTGGTYVVSGVLEINNGNAIPAGTGLIVGAGGTFVFDPTVSGASSNSALSAGFERLGSTTVVPEPGVLVLLAAAICSAAIYRGFRLPRGGFAHRENKLPSGTMEGA